MVEKKKSSVKSKNHTKVETAIRRISVVVPVYENENSLLPLITRLTNLENNLKDLNFELELIFVDDGSKDNSWEVLKSIKEKRPRTKIVKLVRNFGSIKCSKTGLKFATGEVFTILAADLQDPPELILEMALIWEEGNPFVICERNSRHDPVSTRIFASFFYRFLRVFSMPTYPKGGFDLFLLDSIYLDYVVESAKSTYTPILIWWLGLEPKIIKYDRSIREHGKSKWTFTKKFNAFIDITVGFSIRPIRTITFTGFFMALLSFFFGCLVLINAFFGRVKVQGYASIAILLSFLMSVIILTLGLLGEYVWRIFEEGNKRPDTVIEKTLL